MHAALGRYKEMVQVVMTYCSTAFLFMSETNRNIFEQLEKRSENIIFGVHYQQGDRLLSSFANVQKMQYAVACPFV